MWQHHLMNPYFVSRVLASNEKTVHALLPEALWEIFQNPKSVYRVVGCIISSTGMMSLIFHHENNSSYWKSLMCFKMNNTHILYFHTFWKTLSFSNEKPAFFMMKSFYKIQTHGLTSPMFSVLDPFQTFTNEWEPLTSLKANFILPFPLPVGCITV